MLNRQGQQGRQFGTGRYDDTFAELDRIWAILDERVEDEKGAQYLNPMVIRMQNVVAR